MLNVNAAYTVGFEGMTEEEVADAAQMASLADETPEGRSIVVLAKERFNIRERDLGANHEFVPFTATTRNTRCFSIPGNDPLTSWITSSRLVSTHSTAIPARTHSMITFAPPSRVNGRMC